MKNNFSTLQERIVNWVFFATQEEFEISVEEDAQVLKFVQSNYLLLQATNKILRTAATCREKNVADLKEKMKNTVEYYNAEGEKLKLKVQALEEQNRELKRKLSEKDQDLKASKNSLSLEVEKTINRILHVEKAKLDNHLSNSIKSQATLEEKLSNSEKMLRRAWEERKADKKIINSMAKQLWSKDKTVKRLQELEKGYKLRIRKLESGNDNLFLHQQSACDYKLVKVEFLSLPHSPPTTADASSDPRQDENDEHSVNPELLGPEEAAHRL
jgi:chromosome segregation ATPase